MLILSRGAGLRRIAGGGLIPLILVISSVLSCADDPRDTAAVVRAVFDPEEKAIPLPSDLVVDDKTGLLDIPTAGKGYSPAEEELYSFLNTMDAWPSSTQARVDFSSALDQSSVTAATVQMWRWDGTKPERYIKGKLGISEGGTRVTVDPPAEGWPRGASMALVVRGDKNGVKGAKGEAVECAPAFYFLRLKQKLTTDSTGWYRAFPGETLAKRLEAAQDLEEVRLDLSPYMDHLEKAGNIPRLEVASLSTFKVNKFTEVLMDKESGKMPLPIDLLVDPTTGKVDLPPRDDDDAKTKEIKGELKVLDGFGTTTGQLFEFSAKVDKSTVSSATVQLYRVKDATPIPATVTLLSDGITVEVMPKSLPLDSETTYAVVLRQGLRDAAGGKVWPMLTGHFLRAKVPLLDINSKPTIPSLDAADAAKLERSRVRLAPLMDKLGRTSVLMAWPFTTMTINRYLVEAQRTAETKKLPADPRNVKSKSAIQAAIDFPIGVVSVLRVGKVFEGEIATADYLDPSTRRRFKDGKYITRYLPFMATIPSSASKTKPLPVVIFGHAIATERRFVLAVANSLARQGFASIAIDFPYHGSRSHCAWNGPICWPDPINKGGQMLCPNQCKSGSKCGSDGKCRDGGGNLTALPKWPIIPMYQASGAAFIELSSLPGTREHFLQAVIDLGALSRSIQKGDWKKATGYSFKTDKVYYLGQSLGGIIGATYTALDPAMDRVVLNVPGGNVVPMFQDSKYFGEHIKAYLKRESITKGTTKYMKFLHLAKWFVDGIDPLNVARYLMKSPLPGQGTTNSRQVLVQMATLDFIIPNTFTKQLATLAGARRKDYLAEHAFLVIPVEPAYLPGGRDAADFLAGKLK